MSLILEALKKSEARRRLGDMPDLGTPFATRARRRSVLPYLLAAIALAAVAGWWFMRSRTSVQSGQHAPAPAHLATAKMRSARSAAATKSHRERSAASQPAAKQQTFWVAAQRSRAEQDQGNTPTAVQRMKRHGAEPAATRQEAAQHVAPNSPAPGRSTAQQPAPNADTANASASSAAHAGPVEPQKPGVQAPAETARSGNPSPSRLNLPPGVPIYYELPYNIRHALPQLNLSMHVYAKDPSQRFVILNNSRMVEGDKTSDDITLDSIRPDGVILEFQGQRFFYPRDAF